MASSTFLVGDHQTAIEKTLREVYSLRESDAIISGDALREFRGSFYHSRSRFIAV